MTWSREQYLDRLARIEQDFGLDDEFSEKHRSPRFLPLWWMLPGAAFGAAVYAAAMAWIF